MVAAGGVPSGGIPVRQDISRTQGRSSHEYDTGARILPNFQVIGLAMGLVGTIRCEGLMEANARDRDKMAGKISPYDGLGWRGSAMFEEIILAAQELDGQHEFSISIPLDAKGYYDRVCPSKECGRGFKVLFDDWRDKVSDERVFCPFCRHEGPSDEWDTEEQAEHIHSAAEAEANRLLNNALERAVARTPTENIGGGPLNISVSLSYTPGDVPAVVPAKATDSLQQEFACEACGCRYASLGASFFCPACGHNSVVFCFDTALKTVRNAVEGLKAVRAVLEQAVNADTAQDAVRQILEDQVPRLAGAFEQLNEALFEKVPGGSQLARKGNVFQRTDEASALWRQATGKGYEDFLSVAELNRLKVFVQRRHVLSHRQGIVDHAYITKSGETTYAVGQRLVVREGDVLELVVLLGKVADGLKCLV